MDTTFRVGRFYGRLGAAGMFGFSAWCAGGLYIALTAPGIPDRLLAALFMAGVPALMGGLSAWCWLAYRRARLTIQGERIIVQGVLVRREIGLPKVEAVHWRLWPQGGSVVLRGNATKLSISFANYEPAALSQIVGHLRASLRPEIQSGWNLFAYKLAPFQPEAKRNKLGPYDIVVRRSRLDRYFLPAFVVACIISGVSWWLTGPSRWLAAPAQLLVLWVITRVLWPADGMVHRKVSHPDSVALYRFGALWFSAGVVLLVAGRAIHGQRDDADGPTIFGAVVWFAIFLFEYARHDRNRAQREREAADLAADGRADRPASSRLVEELGAD